MKNTLMTDNPERTAGARLPAEWEPHRATHLSFPANRNDWPGKFAAIRWAFVEFVRHLAPHEKIVMAVNGDTIQRNAERMFKDAGIDLGAVEFHQTALDRGWMRDISPFFVKNPRKHVSLVKFLFNGWAKYDNHTLDQKWADQIADALQIPLAAAAHSGRTVVLEGGAVDTNGAGDMLTTEECLLDEMCQARNPGFTKRDYEACFKAYLGVRNVLWLGAGIAGDDTHGHVDDICRFVNPSTVVVCREHDSKDANYAVLEENWERLQSARLHNGHRLEVIELPMPSPLYFRGVRLPASYANFYIANHLVLAPTFNDVHDRIALGILDELFPDRNVIGIHAVDLLWGFGTLHCLSHEEPRQALMAARGRIGG